MGRRAEGRDRHLISREENRSQSVDRVARSIAPVGHGQPRNDHSGPLGRRLVCFRRFERDRSLGGTNPVRETGNPLPDGPGGSGRGCVTGIREMKGFPGCVSGSARWRAVWECEVSDGTAELFGTLAEIPEACTAAEAVTTVGSVKVDGTIATVRVTDSSAPSTRRTRRRPSARSSWTRAPAAVHWAPVTTTTYSWTGADQWAAFGRGERPDLFRQCQVSRVPTRTPRLPTVHGLVPPACP